MRFGTILADPPWAFNVWSDKSQRKVTNHYQTQDGIWIASLPIQEVAAKDCTLLLWATNPNLSLACRVVAAWGFEQKSALTWAKMQAAAAPRIGLGYHARAVTEHLLIATCGNPPAPAPSERPCGLIFSPRGAHSRKPEWQYEIAERYPGPRLEMFSRPYEGGLFPPREGWTFLGDACDGRDMRQALCDLAHGKGREG